MNSKTPLKSKSSLKAKTPIKKGVGKKQTKPNITKLKKDADKYFSYYIRLRDSWINPDGSWTGTCITCPRKLLVRRADGTWTRGAEHGHLIGRGNWFLRYDEENGNLQCSHCNAWLDKDEMIERYRGAVDDKYGKGTYKKLKKVAKENEKYNIKRSELEQVISDAKECIAFYENLT